METTLTTKKFIINEGSPIDLLQFSDNRFVSRHHLLSNLMRYDYKELCEEVDLLKTNTPRKLTYYVGDVLWVYSEPDITLFQLPQNDEYFHVISIENKHIVRK